MSCHPAYDAPQGAVLRPDAAQAKITESAFGTIVATDLRNTFRAGDAPQDIYRVISAGIGGTAMPSWNGALTASDTWALVHYVRSLRGAGEHSAL